MSELPDEKLHSLVEKPIVVTLETKVEEAPSAAMPATPISTSDIAPEKDEEDEIAEATAELKDVSQEIPEGPGGEIDTAGIPSNVPEEESTVPVLMSEVPDEKLHGLDEKPIDVTLEIKVEDASSAAMPETPISASGIAPEKAEEHEIAEAAAEPKDMSQEIHEGPGGDLETAGIPSKVSEEESAIPGLMSEVPFEKLHGLDETPIDVTLDIKVEGAPSAAMPETSVSTSDIAPEKAEEHETAEATAEPKDVSQEIRESPASVFDGGELETAGIPSKVSEEESAIPEEEAATASTKAEEMRLGHYVESQCQWPELKEDNTVALVPDSLPSDKTEIGGEKSAESSSEPVNTFTTTAEIDDFLRSHLFSEESKESQLEYYKGTDDSSAIVPQAAVHLHSEINAPLRSPDCIAETPVYMSSEVTAEVEVPQWMTEDVPVRSHELGENGSLAEISSEPRVEKEEDTSILMSEAPEIQIPIAGVDLITSEASNILSALKQLIDPAKEQAMLLRGVLTSENFNRAIENRDVEGISYELPLVLSGVLRRLRDLNEMHTFTDTSATQILSDIDATVKLILNVVDMDILDEETVETTSIILEKIKSQRDEIGKEVLRREKAKSDAQKNLEDQLRELRKSIETCHETIDCTDPTSTDENRIKAVLNDLQRQETSVYKLKFSMDPSGEDEPIADACLNALELRSRGMNVIENTDAWRRYLEYCQSCKLLIDILTATSGEQLPAVATLQDIREKVETIQNMAQSVNQACSNVLRSYSRLSSVQKSLAANAHEKLISEVNKSLIRSLDEQRDLQIVSRIVQRAQEKMRIADESLNQLDKHTDPNNSKKIMEHLETMVGRSIDETCEDSMVPLGVKIEVLQSADKVDSVLKQARERSIAPERTALLTKKFGQNSAVLLAEVARVEEKLQNLEPSSEQLAVSIKDVESHVNLCQTVISRCQALEKFGSLPVEVDTAILERVQAAQKAVKLEEQTLGLELKINEAEHRIVSGTYSPKETSSRMLAKHQLEKKQLEEILQEVNGISRKAQEFDFPEVEHNAEQLRNVVRRDREAMSSRVAGDRVWLKKLRDQDRQSLALRECNTQILEIIDDADDPFMDVYDIQMVLNSLDYVCGTQANLMQCLESDACEGEEVGVLLDTSGNVQRKAKEVQMSLRNCLAAFDDFREWTDSYQAWERLVFADPLFQGYGTDVPQTALIRTKELLQQIQEWEHSLRDRDQFLNSAVPSDRMQAQRETMENVAKTLSALKTILESLSGDFETRLLSREKIKGVVDDATNELHVIQSSEHRPADSNEMLDVLESDLQKLNALDSGLKSLHPDVRDEAVRILEVMKEWQKVFETTFEQYVKVASSLPLDQVLSTQRLEQSITEAEEVLRERNLPSDREGLRLKLQETKTSLSSLQLHLASIPLLPALSEMNHDTITTLKDRETRISQHLSLWDVYDQRLRETVDWLKKLEHQRDSLMLHHVPVERLERLMSQIQVIIESAENSTSLDDLNKATSDLVSIVCDESMKTSLNDTGSNLRLRLSHLKAALKTWHGHLTSLRDSWSNIRGDCKKVQDILRQVSEAEFGKKTESSELLEETLEKLTHADSLIQSSHSRLDEIIGLSSPRDVRHCRRELWALSSAILCLRRRIEAGLESDVSIPDASERREKIVDELSKITEAAKHPSAMGRTVQAIQSSISSDLLPRSACLFVELDLLNNLDSSPEAETEMKFLRQEQDRVSELLDELRTKTKNCREEVSNVETDIQKFRDYLGSVERVLHSPVNCRDQAEARCRVEETVSASKMLNQVRDLQRAVEEKVKKATQSLNELGAEDDSERLNRMKSSCGQWYQHLSDGLEDRLHILEETLELLNNHCELVSEIREELNDLSQRMANAKAQSDIHTLKELSAERKNIEELSRSTHGLRSTIEATNSLLHRLSSENRLSMDSPVAGEVESVVENWNTCIAWVRVLQKRLLRSLSLNTDWDSAVSRQSSMLENFRRLLEESSDASSLASELEEGNDVCKALGMEMMMRGHPEDAARVGEALESLNDVKGELVLQAAQTPCESSISSEVGATPFQAPSPKSDEQLVLRSADIIKELVKGTQESTEMHLLTALDEASERLARLEESSDDEETRKTMAAACLASCDVIDYLRDKLVSTYGYPESHSIIIQADNVRVKQMMVRKEHLSKIRSESEERRDYHRFETNLWRLEKWQTSAEKRIQSLILPEDVSISIESLEETVPDFREFLLDLDSHKTLVNSLSSLGRHLIQNCSDQDKAQDLEVRLEQVRMQWDEICRKVAKAQESIQRHLVENSEFCSQMDFLMNWIGGSEAEVRSMEPLDLDAPRAELERQLKRFQELETDALKFQQRLESLLEALASPTVPLPGRSTDDAQASESLLNRSYSMLGRAVRIALPIQALILLLVGVASVLPICEDEYSCVWPSGSAPSTCFNLAVKLDGGPPT
ncbi:unnamed protein product [Cyprideis torosa]|uniref:Uncharacterized protein n=1 Tax=Cyprideis torosa TaxID=163714 RepID=A0A7R8W274_9CRUS|nr:unnamed protein product [Cyprideis torosa]CAG0880676.1 unnamed protein product [Cyprideis torosa]